VIFGPGDSFFNRFAGLLRLAGPVFPLACPGSRFAPVCVSDVAEAMYRALDAATTGERLELCGPQVYTLRELVEYTRDQLGLRCRIIGLGDTLSRLQARLLGILPGKPFSMDNYHSLQKDSVCVRNALPTLGITPTPIAAVVPRYLTGAHSRGRYQALHAGADARTRLHTGRAGFPGLPASRNERGVCPGAHRAQDRPRLRGLRGPCRARRYPGG
jgi:NADH dehydrogenase